MVRSEWKPPFCVSQGVYTALPTGTSILLTANLVDLIIESPISLYSPDSGTINPIFI